jgi:electron transfer flavoprotein beta subunit
MKYKHARTVSELVEETKDYTEMMTNKPYLRIEEWSVADLDADVDPIPGIVRFSHKVKKIENVVLPKKILFMPYCC